MSNTPVIPHAHIIPVDDSIEHEASENCICGPDIQFVSGGAIISHHYLQKIPESTLEMTS